MARSLRKINRNRFQKNNFKLLKKTKKKNCRSVTVDDNNVVYWNNWQLNTSWAQFSKLTCTFNWYQRRNRKQNLHSRYPGWKRCSHLFKFGKWVHNKRILSTMCQYHQDLYFLYYMREEMRGKLVPTLGRL